MTHLTFEFYGVKLAVVSNADNDVRLDEYQEFAEVQLLVHDEQLVEIYVDDEGEVVMQFATNAQRPILIDGQIQTNLIPRPVSDGTLIIVGEAVYVITKGHVAQFLTGQLFDLSELRNVRYEYVDIDNAFQVWDDTVISPDSLAMVGRAIYNQIVWLTGQRYRERA